MKIEPENDRTKAEKYREHAIYGGSFLGAVAAAVGAAPHLKSWSQPIASFGAILLGCAAIGALVGYLFIESIISSQAVGGNSEHSNADGDVSANHSSSDGGGTSGGGGDATD